MFNGAPPKRHARNHGLGAGTDSSILEPDVAQVPGENYSDQANPRGLTTRD